MARKIDLRGQRFCRWLVLEFDSVGEDNKAYWKCCCDCGTIRVVLGKSLRSGMSKSCGCLQRERASEANKGKLVSEETRQKMRKKSRKVDLTGQRFGSYSVLEEAGRKWGRVLWKCRCDCGIEKIVDGVSLRWEVSKSCGCFQSGKIDLIEQRFGRYIVLEYVYSKNGKAYWKCLCDCDIEKIVCGAHLRSGVTRSCGCLRDERAAEAHYNPNLTDEDRQDRRIISGYTDWRTAVYERDNYTCQCCGDNRGGNLVAHHLDGYDNFPELRTLLENGITLCEKCHGNFHHMFGYGSNTRRQFEEFLHAQEKLEEIRRLDEWQE